MNKESVDCDHSIPLHTTLHTWDVFDVVVFAIHVGQLAIDWDLVVERLLYSREVFFEHHPHPFLLNFPCYAWHDHTQHTTNTNRTSTGPQGAATTQRVINENYLLQLGLN